MLLVFDILLLQTFPVLETENKFMFFNAFYIFFVVYSVPAML